MSDNSNDFGVFFAGFVIGGLVGAAFALLMAPQSGEETRTVIREKSIELKDKAVGYSQEARTKAEKALEDARIRAENALEDLQARADDLAKMTKEKAQELQQRGQVVLDEQKARLESAISGAKQEDTAEEAASDAATEA